MLTVVASEARLGHSDYALFPSFDAIIVMAGFGTIGLVRAALPLPHFLHSIEDDIGNESEIATGPIGNIYRDQALGLGQPKKSHMACANSIVNLLYSF